LSPQRPITETYCATVGFADSAIESDNVVGYQKQSLSATAGKYVWLVNTFKNIDGSTTKLKDFAVSEKVAMANVKIYFLNESGATVADAQGRKGFQYVHPEWCTAANKWVSGWYAANMNGKNVTTAEYVKGSTSDFWANEVEVPYKQGFGVQRASQTATLLFNGAVANMDAEIPLTSASGKYTWTGNVMPQGYKLKDLSVKEKVAMANVKIYFLNESGATVADALGRKGFQYVHPEWCTTANKWVPGWYAANMNGKNVTTAEYVKGTTSDFWANEVEIPAGQGVGVQRASQAATLIVPSPLVTK